MAATASTTIISPEMSVDCNGSSVAGVPAAFAPSVWGDFFITYDPPLAQRSEEWMRERAEELKRRVRKMFVFEDGKVASAVALVDTLEHLGIDSHFREEIAAAIGLIHVAGEERPEFVDATDDLYVAATRFRLLRQHGLWVSIDVFDRLRDGDGIFSINQSRDAGDPRALLSLYHAAHMAVPGESALDDVVAFARRNLEDMANKGELRSPAAEQVARALHHPLPRATRQLEAMRYIPEYAKEDTHDGVLLELARLNSSIMRSLHLRELKTLSLWWRDLFDTVNLTYSRDRVVETYFWSCGFIPEAENSRGRLFMCRVFGLLSFLDDTFDEHATFDECCTLNEAIQRWDESVVNMLPEYLRMLYIKTLSNFKELEDVLEPHEKYRMLYAKKAFQQQSEYYMKEAEWNNDKYQPSFEEREELTALSTGLPMLQVVALTGYDAAIANQEVLEYCASVPVPDVLRACALIARFLNDVSSYKLGRKSKSDMPTWVEIYMLEKGMTGDEAMAAVAAMREPYWRVVNRASIETDRGLLPAVQLASSIARTLEVYHLHGRDGYTYGSQVKNLVTALFLDPIPL